VKVLLLLLWVGCNEVEVEVALPHTRTWIPEDALRMTLMRLDTNGDGKLNAGEWTRVSYGGADFDEMDGDGSGDVDLVELVAVVQRLDPDGFDGKTAPSFSRESSPENKVPSEVRSLEEALLFLIEEVRDVEGVVLPSRDEVTAAALTESLYSPESGRVLARIRVAWKEAGRTFPDGFGQSPPGAPQ
jgi:hypothetical protein